jgi:hypothetical protein
MTAASTGTIETSVSTPADSHTRLGRLGARWSRLLVALPATVALMLGAVAAWLFGQRPLDPDVLTYELIARHLGWDAILGGSREPLWPIVFYVPVHLLGGNAWIGIRALGVAGFVFMVIVFQALVRNLFGRTWSIVAALVVAVSPFMVFQATRGLREETSAALLLLLCLGLVQPRLSSRRFILLFGLTAVTGLLRADVMDVMLGALALSLLVRRPSPVVWLAGPAIVVAAIAPEYVADYLETGDPFFHTNVLARFFRNIEFAGQPGFITVQQMKIDAFGGSPVTWTQYIFGMHSPAELMKRAVIAFLVVPAELTGLDLFFATRVLPAPVVIVRDALQPGLIVVAWLLGAVGGLALLRTRAWVVPVIIAGQILLYSTIAQYMDYRLVLDLFPLFLICIIYGLISVAGWTKTGSTMTALES